MQLVLLGLIPILLLAGIVAFAVGNKGWNWGTISAAILVLLAATGYTFLAAMLAQRERTWRTIVESYQSAIASERDGLVPAGGGKLASDPKRKSLSALELDKARWLRVKDRVENWRGRHWDKASFEPPKVGAGGAVAPGKVTIEDLQKVTINPGAELYLFDAKAVEENGRFLGAFSVDSVNGNVLTVSPSMPPTESDKAVWGNLYEEISVYENLPVDRWTAFHRTQPPAEDAGEGGDAASTPGQVKTDPEDLLKHLESRLEEVRHHAETVPEEEWPKVTAAVKAGEALPGRYWARVEFKQAHTVTPTSVARPFGPEPPWQFESGQQGTFDLATAQKLKDDDVAEIIAVESRRPLTDAQTALRGSDYEFAATADNADRPTVQIEGITFVRRMLEADIESIGGMIERLRSAKASADNQLRLQVKEGEDLTSDRTQWQADAEAAAEMAERFEKRVGQLGEQLSGVESEIVELGRELAGASALLVGAIDRVAPPPVRRPAAAP